MARILNTIPDFQRFAGSALRADPHARERLWEEQYRAVHPEVLATYFEGYGSREGLPAVLGQLRGLRARVQAAVALLPDIIQQVEPAVRHTLGMKPAPEPLHVLMVGTFSANAFVARLGGELAVFHCLEWFTTLEPTRVLVAHEDTHAWHEAALGHTPTNDPAWTAFYEGLAIQVSRTVVPDRPEDDYFWYGLAGFEDWLSWCREQRDPLYQRFREALEDEDATERFFGGGFVEERWRVGFFLADELVGTLGRPLHELVRLDAEEAREAIRAALA